jgi:hypothetical protein
LGYDVVRRRAGRDAYPPDFDADLIDLCERVEPYTLTPPARIAELRSAVRYVIEADISGAFVECGVWRGGSMMVIAETLQSLGVSDRDLYLFDTFTYVPEPGEHDHDVFGSHADEYFDAAVESGVFDHLPIEQVRRLLEATGYPPERFHFVEGKVEDTLPEHAPETVALCRLDTDWYESTIHEMEHLYPRIPAGGVLLVDDYGHYLGAKKAVDEYFAARDEAVLLHRIDFSARLVIKPGN